MLPNIVYFTLCIFILAEANVIREDDLELSIIHFNDFHARFDEVSKNSGVCKDSGECHGGFARLYTSIMELMSERKNPILLDIGDNFQGTLYYNFFKWNITEKFINLLPITAHTIGNHEFDDRVKGLTPFLKALKAPVVVSNIDDSLEPEIQGLYRKSVVTIIDGRKIGIVGVISSKTDELSNTDNLKFLDELESVNKEAVRLAKEEAVFTVIILSHCGYAVDLQMAKGLTKGASLIVGSHSHTLLYNGTPPDGSVAKGPYPTIVPRDTDGSKVLVVQASSYTRYLGDLNVMYSNSGELVSWSGNPIYLGPDVKQDEMIVNLLEPWKAEVEALGKEVLGSTLVELNSSECSSNECNFGNFLADSIVHSYMNDVPSGCWTRVALALYNSGGIRSSIPIGNITFNDVMTAQPFENTFDSGVLQGKYIKEVFEKTAMPYFFRSRASDVNLLQVSGFKVEYDLSRPEGDRVTSLKLRSKCSEAYEFLEYETYYDIAFVSFLGKGGDGFSAISDNIFDYVRGDLDAEVIRRYVAQQSPITISKEGRLLFHGN